MTVKEFLVLLADYYPGTYTKTQQAEVIKYLDATEPGLLAYLWEALKKVPLYGKDRPLIEHLETARAEAVRQWERAASYLDARIATTALLPDEPTLPREETARRLKEITQGLLAAKLYGTKGGNRDRERNR